MITNGFKIVEVWQCRECGFEMHWRYVPIRYHKDGNPCPECGWLNQSLIYQNGDTEEQYNEQREEINKHTQFTPCPDFPTYMVVC